MNKYLDVYSIKARYYPLVIVVAPICLLVLSTASGHLDVIKSLGATIISGFGLAFIMDQVGRDLGRNKQTDLFNQWGGMPTTVLLRHRDQTLGDTTKARYHHLLSKKIPDLVIPSEQSETAEPFEADDVYASCADFLRSATRTQSDFPLIFEENCNYGFRRNLWGMRPAGITLSIIGTIACGAVVLIRLDQPGDAWLIPAISVLISAVLLCMWIFRFRSSWVKMTAFAYALQLLAACDSPHINR